jgi:hypothetical protein
MNKCHNSNKLLKNKFANVLPTFAGSSKFRISLEEIDLLLGLHCIQQYFAYFFISQSLRLFRHTFRFTIYLAQDLLKRLKEMSQHTKLVK